MPFSQEKRNRIKNYILEKIFRGDSDFVKSTIDAFDITATSVYKYLKELEASEKIIKEKNGVYRLTVSSENHFSYNLSEKNDEDRIYNQTLKNIISDLPKNITAIWQYGFMEMVNNALEHSQAQNLDIHILRNSLYTWVYIVDNGIGIFNKIAGFYGFEDEDEAILTLFKGKLTTDAKHHSGEGIFFTSKVMDHFFAVSNGKIFTQSNTLEKLSDVPESIIKQTVGTAIIMGLANNSKLEISDVFDEFASVDGGFSKTKIPVCKVCDSGYPVSRSQAKRLCFGLEKFKKVILDFNKVDDMGQGFAHELLVVFKNYHPEVEFEFINANEKVLKMIKHVLG